MKGGRVVGIVATRDLLLAAANFGSAEVPVGEIMRGPVECVTERATLSSAARRLVMKGIGSLPVLNAKRELVGIITETDVFKVMAGMVRPKRRAPAAKKRASAARAKTPARRKAKKK
jgi:predicted transcriptional regulator